MKIQHTDSIKLTIPGKPIPLKRARIGRGRVYDGQKALKGRVIASISGELAGVEMCSKPMSVCMKFFMAIPKSISNKERVLISGKVHYKKPDVSNLLKFVEDLLIGKVWEDDRLISEIYAIKVYDAVPRTEIIATVV
jgi:Holliday junction resolvase RusA-like endonuclease